MDIRTFQKIFEKFRQKRVVEVDLEKKNTRAQISRDFFRKLKQIKDILPYISTSKKITISPSPQKFEIFKQKK